MKSFCFSLFLICAFVAHSQDFKTPTLSPRSTITQELGLTEVTVSYSRPSAKGRKVFGHLVPFDQIWRTGANAATTISIPESCRIGGKPVPAGKFAIYTIPGEEVWTVIIHTNTSMRSLAGDRYKKENDLMRFDVQTLRSNDYVETFTITFTSLTTNSAQLALAWENTQIIIPIEVEVDKKIETALENMLEGDEISHRYLFEAAQYYLHNNKDLGLALLWIDQALLKSTENFRYGLLKSKIEYASGDSKQALITINKSHTWAVKAGSANYIEQTDLFRKEILKR